MIVPATSAPLRFAESTLLDEASVPERVLLGDVVNIRPCLQAMNGRIEPIRSGRQRGRVTGTVADRHRRDPSAGTRPPAPRATPCAPGGHRSTVAGMHPDAAPDPDTAAFVARPPRTYVTGRVTRGLRRAALILTALVAGGILVAYPNLPEAIPTHFDNAGRADGFGPKSVLLTVLAVFVAIELALAWGSRYPRWFTYPVSVTEENAQRLYRAGEQMIVWKAAIVAVLLLGLALAVLGGFPLLACALAGLIALLVSLIVGIARMFRV